MARKNRQIEMTFRRHGGARKGAGRKRRLPGKRRVSHRRRAPFSARSVIHVTARIRDDLPRLRNFKRCRVIRRALVKVLGTPGFGVCEFSVQHNHLHLICEAGSSQCLAKGMKRLNWHIARGLNAQLDRTGSVFADRYHADRLASPRRVRNTLCYVLHNARRHGVTLDPALGGIDPFSSARTFTGWTDDTWRAGVPPPQGPCCVSSAETWLLSVGWRRHGLIMPTETPAATRGSAAT